MIKAQNLEKIRAMLILKPSMALMRAWSANSVIKRIRMRIKGGGKAWSRYQREYNEINQGFVSNFQVFLEGKASFYTANSHVAIGPKYTYRNNHFCVINSCPLPVLLRSDGSGYVLIRAAYICGLSGDKSFNMYDTFDTRMKYYVLGSQ